MEEGFGSQFDRVIVHHHGGDRSLNGNVWLELLTSLQTRKPRARARL